MRYDLKHVSKNDLESADKPITAWERIRRFVHNLLRWRQGFLPVSLQGYFVNEVCIGTNEVMNKYEQFNVKTSQRTR